MLQADTREVRRLRLRAANEALVRRGAVLVEDALRIATLPDPSGSRVVFVRSLDLGRIATSGSSMSVALAVQRALDGLSSDAVHMSSPPAADAMIVYADDPLQPWLLLARKLARREAVKAWFWPRAVPGWRAGRSIAEGLRGILVGLLEHEAAPAATIALVEILAREGALESLLDGLSSDDGARLLRTIGGAGGEPKSQEKERASLVVTTGLLRDVLGRRVRQWGPDDSRSVWLVALAMAQGRARRLSDAGLVFRAREACREIARGSAEIALAGNGAVSSPVADGPRSLAFVSTPTIPPATTPGASNQPKGRNKLERAAGDPARVDGAGADVPQRDEDSADSRPLSSLSPSRLPTPPGRQPLITRETESEYAAGSMSWESPARRIATEFGGLYFLLHALARLGFASWLRDHPQAGEADVGQRVLRALAERTGCAVDDAVLTAVKFGDDAPAFGYRTPQSWRGEIYRGDDITLHAVEGRKGARVLRDAESGLIAALAEESGQIRDLLGTSEVSVHRGERLTESPRPAVETWAVAVAIWCRRFTGMEVEEIVKRPGAVLMTRTHLEMYFDLRRADLRIRRAGLDINPGWVGWLGRVVNFWYIEAGEAAGDAG